MKFRLSTPIAIPIGSAAALLFASWRLFFWFSESGPPLLLRFHVGSGVDLFGSRDALIVLPASASILFVVNMLLLIAFWRRDRVFFFLFAWATVIIETLFLFALGVLFWANRT